MFTTYTPDEIHEIVIAGLKNKKNVASSLEEKLFHTIKHVTLFADMEPSDVMQIAGDIKINRYQAGDTISLTENEQRIFYVVNGSVSFILKNQNEVELGKDHIFGEAAALTKTLSDARVIVNENDTVLFSFRLNKNGANDENALLFLRFYGSLCDYMAHKLLWFDMA